MKINPLIYVVLAVIVLGILFFLFKPKTAESPQNTSEPPNPSTDIATSAAQLQSHIKTFELVIKEKKIVSGPVSIQVTQGDKITIKVTADEEEEFHVHAYDNSVELEPGKQATLTFTANLSGRFPFELENSKTEIGALEVQPK